MSRIERRTLLVLVLGGLLLGAPLGASVGGDPFAAAPEPILGGPLAQPPGDPDGEDPADADPPGEEQDAPGGQQDLEAEPSEERGEAFRGRLRFEGDPVPGVLVSVFRDGEPVGQGRSDAEGDWRVAVPGPGTYRVELALETLPEGIEIRDPEQASREMTLRAGRERTVLFPLGERAAAGGVGFRRVAQAVANGLKFGLIIAMAAIGLSLVYGTTRLVNFAHGDLVTVGAVMAWYLNAGGPGIQIIPAAAIAIGAGAVIGGGLERGLWRPLRSRQTGMLQLFVISIGLALFTRHVVLLFFGGRPRPYLDYTVQSTVSLGPIAMTPRDLTVIGISVLVLVAVGLMLLRTRLGKAMRAVRDNRDLAEASGIDVGRIILYVWMFAGGLAAFGGVLFGVVENVNWLMGFRLLLLMFAAVILGGLGTAFGAMAGGIVVGVFTEVSTLFSPIELKFMWGLVVLVLVLLVRPQGIFGTRERIG